jgi:hypothetical protein
VRKAINENPVVQVVVIGILGIAVAFLFMTRVMSSGSGDDGGSAESSASATPVTSSAAAGSTSAASAPATGDASGQTAPAASSSATAPAAGMPGFEPGPGLPKAVVAAHQRGDAVALLVTERKGIEDKPLRRYVEDLRTRSDVAVFVTTVRDVARYSRIARGVELNRAPALVIIKPRAGGGGDALPAATIHYGYRGPDSVRTALRDAFYKGKQLPYHPG